MRTETLEGFLTSLASKSPAPGGGAVGGLQISMGAGLAAMVAHYTTGAKFEDVGAEIADVLARAERIVDDGMQVAHEDATAFEGVGVARKMPKDTEEQAAARDAAIEEALYSASDPAVATLRLAEEVMGLAQTLARIGNPYLLPDVGAAATCAEAAASIAWGNLASNLAAVADTPRKRELLSARDTVERLGELRRDVLDQCAQRSA